MSDGYVTLAESERLTLREITPGDFMFLLGMFNNPEVMKFYGGLRDEAKTRAWIEFNLNNYKRFGFSKWIVTRKADDKPIGHCGFQSTLIDGAEEMELGFSLDQPYWHQGYATEAAKAALSLGFDTLGFRRIISAINPKNQPSIAVALRTGMQKQKSGTARVNEIVWDADIYVIEKPAS